MVDSMIQLFQLYLMITVSPSNHNETSLDDATSSIAMKGGDHEGTCVFD
jgi:hypothetical protein